MFHTQECKGKIGNGILVKDKGRIHLHIRIYIHRNIFVLGEVITVGKRKSA